jgi:hypothetical protein
VAQGLRARIERIEGIAFDVVLLAIAAWVAEDWVQAWLLEHPAGLYWSLSALHLAAFPFMLYAIMMGWGRAGRPEEVNRSGSGALGWAVALYFGGSFVVPGVLTMVLDVQLWVMMTTIFGPLGLFALVVTIAIVGEKRGWWPPAQMHARPSMLAVQALALVSWGYLVCVETMMIVAAGTDGPIGEVGLAFGVLINYVPLRVLLFYVRDSYPWERWTIVLTTLHLLLRVGSAQT